MDELAAVLDDEIGSSIDGGTRKSQDSGAIYGISIARGDVEVFQGAINENVMAISGNSNMA